MLQPKARKPQPRLAAAQSIVSSALGFLQSWILLNKIFPAAKQRCSLVLRSTIWIHVETLKSFLVNSTAPSMIPKSQTKKTFSNGQAKPPGRIHPCNAWCCGWALHLRAGARVSFFGDITEKKHRVDHYQRDLQITLYEPRPPSTINCNKTSQSWQQIFVGRFWPSGTHVQNPARLHVGKTQMALRSPHPVQDLGYLGWGSLQCRKVGMIGIKCGKTSHIFQEQLRLSIMFSLASSLPYFAHAQYHTASASSKRPCTDYFHLTPTMILPVSACRLSAILCESHEKNFQHDMRCRNCLSAPMRFSSYACLTAGRYKQSTVPRNHQNEHSYFNKT